MPRVAASARIPSRASSGHRWDCSTPAIRADGNQPPAGGTSRIAVLPNQAPARSLASGWAGALGPSPSTPAPSWSGPSLRCRALTAWRRPPPPRVPAPRPPRRSPPRRRTPPSAARLSRPYPARQAPVRNRAPPGAVAGPSRSRLRAARSPRHGTRVRHRPPAIELAVHLERFGQRFFARREVALNGCDLAQPKSEVATPAGSPIVAANRQRLFVVRRASARSRPAASAPRRR